MKHALGMVAAAAASIALLASCSSVTSGEVTGKQYRPADTYYVSTCVSYNSRGFCSLYLPMPETDPECWELDLNNDGKTGSVCVDSETWKKYTKGEQYP